MKNIGLLNGLKSGKKCKKYHRRHYNKIDGTKRETSTENPHFYLCSPLGQLVVQPVTLQMSHAPINYMHLNLCTYCFYYAKDVQIYSNMSFVTEKQRWKQTKLKQANDYNDYNTF